MASKILAWLRAPVSKKVASKPFAKAEGATWGRMCPVKGKHGHYGPAPLRNKPHLWLHAGKWNCCMQGAGQWPVIGTIGRSYTPESAYMMWILENGLAAP